ncbi:hypothetical protein [Methylobacterium sp. Leaf100]|uniref:hypothetical protein n=1 Tax=Methylobacterium sp. Leaf100 TaxID=1736252 RepID=UPI0012E24ACC|nr:hypothetical protein [Methylobacterium sp. Leaf100]
MAEDMKNSQPIPSVADLGDRIRVVFRGLRPDKYPALPNDYLVLFVQIKVLFVQDSISTVFEVVSDVFCNPEH